MDAGDATWQHESPGAPGAGPPDEPIPHELIAAVAYELWAMHGGNEVLNWLEAERLLRRMFTADRAAPPQDAADAWLRRGDGPCLAEKCANGLNGQFK